MKKTTSLETSKLECLTDCALVSPTNYNRLMTPGKQPTSTVSFTGSMSTLLALQETWLPPNSSLQEQDHVFFWQGKEPKEPQVLGVGFAVRKLLSAMKRPSKGTACILALHGSSMDLRPCEHPEHLHLPHSAPLLGPRSWAPLRARARHQECPCQRTPVLTWRFQCPSGSQPQVLAQQHWSLRHW